MTGLQALLDQIDRLDQEATKGPWTTGENDETGLKYFGTGYCDCCTPPIPSAGVILGETGRAEAEFIALARTALPALSRAVRVVMELHTPEEFSDHNGDGVMCNECMHDDGTFMLYPCPTVQAITDALGANSD